MKRSVVRVMMQGTRWEEAEGEELEPGVKFFVLMLEKLGCKTYASCEGHPNGFYILCIPQETTMPRQRRGREPIPPDPPASTPASTPSVDLGALDLSRLLGLAQSLEEWLGHYQRHATAAGFRPTEPACGSLTKCDMLALQAEAEFTRLGMSGDAPTLAYKGTWGARSDAVRGLLEWLRDARGGLGNESGWGETLPPAAVWGSSPAAMLPNLAGELAWLHNIVRDLAEVAEERPPEPPTIWYHGGRSYSRDGKRPVCVSAEQHNFLKEFLDNSQAIVTKDLSKGICNVTDVAKKLAEKFPDAICFPKEKGDGYFVRVRSLRPD
jgi:hypothetical protein